MEIRMSLNVTKRCMTNGINNSMKQEPILNAHNKEEYPPMHTAEHILNQTMVRMFGCPRSRNAHIERKKSKCDYQLATSPTDEQVQEIERRVNEVIAMGLPVSYEFVKRGEVPPYAYYLPTKV